MAGSNCNGLEERRTDQGTVAVKIISNHDQRNISGQQWAENRKANEEEGERMWVWTAVLGVLF